MGTSREVFLGVDVGTQGVRVAALDAVGEVVATARRPFPLADQSQEQSPEEWWGSVCDGLSAVAAELKRQPGLIPVALTVTSTSGTIVPHDAGHRPVHPALMYSDKRATAESAEIERLAPDLGCNLSWGLPKIVWFERAFQEQSGRVVAWRHAGDVILGRLSGIWDVTDVTNALKSGYDPVADSWPTDLFRSLGLPDVSNGWLPRVVDAGIVIGPILPEIAAETGLPPALLITTGMTDGCASQVASGATRPGDWATTIGTTMVVKGVTRSRIVDPDGLVYSHRHPDGWWMPGGASNTGAEWIARDHGGHDLGRLDAEAAPTIPTGQIAYPLRQAGERFPFAAPGAQGFDPPGLDGPALFAARLEGVAYLERLALERLEDLSGERIGRVHAAGGGSQSDLWLRIRASVLGKPVLRTRSGEAAAGAAVIAAGGTRFGGLADAAAAMTGIVATVEPGREAAAYEEGYGRFLAALSERGYLREGAKL